jgi:ribosome-associated protein
LTTKKRSNENGAERPAKPRKAAPKAPKGPRIHASHAQAPRAEAAKKAKPRPQGASGDKPRRPRAPGLKADRPGPAVKKAPLGAPRRAAGGARRSVVAAVTPEAATAARELALQLAAAGIDKKALAIEILDVVGKIDYADFLVIMTGRSDRHVHAIATGLEEAMRRKKSIALSVEGLQAATWVLLDFGDVVVHVFQEDARALYDIEGLWIDAGRVPVPNTDGAGPNAPTSHLD